MILVFQQKLVQFVININSFLLDLHVYPSWLFDVARVSNQVVW